MTLHCIAICSTGDPASRALACERSGKFGRWRLRSRPILPTRLLINASSLLPSTAYAAGAFNTALSMSSTFLSVAKMRRNDSFALAAATPTSLARTFSLKKFSHAHTKQRSKVESERARSLPLKLNDALARLNAGGRGLG